VSAPNIILRNDIKANKIEIIGDAEVNKPCEAYRKDAKDANEDNVEKMRQNVHENIAEKVVPSQVLKQDIIIDRVKAATMKIPLVISELNTKAVIDTGAEVTVLSEAFYFNIPEHRRPKLKAATRNLVVAEAGKQISSIGIVEVDIQLGNEKFIWPVYVAPIGECVLLGCDIIDEKDITINSKRGLQLGGQWIC
jgi:predicted aspartyl protease